MGNMLEYNELRPGKTFILDGEPYVVLDYNFVKKQQRRPTAQLTLKNLLSGKVREYGAHQGSTFEEADIVGKNSRFIYYKEKTGEYWFCSADNPSDRFALKAEVVGDARNYLKENLEVTILSFNDLPISLRLPAKVDLKVTDAPPSVKGGTVSGGTKSVTTETGLKVTTPLFVNAGDVIRVNTANSEYTERV